MANRSGMYSEAKNEDYMPSKSLEENMTFNMHRIQSTYFTCISSTARKPFIQFPQKWNMCTWMWKHVLEHWPGM